jgi:hypothetical protein
MVDDGTPSSTASSQVSSSAIHKATARLNLEAYPAIDNFLAVIMEEGIVVDPTIRTLLFNGLGQYLHILRANFDGDFFAVNQKAMTEIMLDPRISGLVDGALEKMVDMRIGSVVQSRKQ